MEYLCFQHPVSKQDVTLRPAYLELAITQASTEYQREGTKMLGFFSRVLSYVVLEHNILEYGLAEMPDKIKNNYCFVDRNNPNAEEFIAIAHEKYYVDRYQLFETLIFKIYKVMLWYFPERMDSKAYNKYNNFDDNFLDDKLQFIDRYISIEFLKRNIYDILDFVYHAFNLAQSLDLDAKKEILLTALKRNLIIHNNGYVNEKYMNIVAKYGLHNDLDLGDYVFRKRGDAGLNIGSLLKAFEAIQNNIQNDFIKSISVLFSST